MSLRFLFDFIMVSLFIFHFTPIPLRVHFNFTSISLRVHFDSASISLRSHFEFTSVSHRSHFGYTSVSCRSHFGLTSISLRSHIDLTSVPHRFHFDFSSVSLLIHLGLTPISHWFQFDVTSVSLRSHFDSTPISHRFHFGLTSNSLRSPIGFTSISRRSHFGSTSIPLRFHFGLTSNSLRSPIGFTSISRRSHFGSTSIPLRFHFGLIGLTSISLRFHIDFASISLRSHFEFASVSHRCHFDFTSISHWPPLKPSQNRRKRKACGTTGSGGPAARRQPTKSLNPSKNKRKLINTQQNSSRNHQGSSTISQNHFSFSVSLRIHSVSHRFHFDFTSISLWPPLKPSQNTRKAKACGTTGTGGPAAQRQPTKSLNPSKNKRKLINTQQNSSRNNQGPPGIIHDLTEPLFIRFRKTKASTKPRPPRARTHARPRSTNHRIIPSDRITHPGTTKISRFDSPPNLRYMYVYSYLHIYVYIN
jgi:hypothetical protein